MCNGLCVCVCVCVCVWKCSAMIKKGGNDAHDHDRSNRSNRSIHRSVHRSNRSNRSIHHHQATSSSSSVPPPPLPIKTNASTTEPNITSLKVGNSAQTIQIQTFRLYTIYNLIGTRFFFVVVGFATVQTRNWNT